MSRLLRRYVRFVETSPNRPFEALNVRYAKRELAAMSHKERGAWRRKVEQQMAARS
jgi:hypothetical protein